MRSIYVPFFGLNLRLSIAPAFTIFHINLRYQDAKRRRLGFFKPRDIFLMEYGFRKINDYKYL